MVAERRSKSTTDPPAKKSISKLGNRSQPQQRRSIPQPKAIDSDDEDDENEEVIDYAATADEFFSHGDDDDDDDDDDDHEGREEIDDAGDAEDDDDDDDDDDDNDTDENDMPEDVEENEKSDGADDIKDDDDDEEEEEEENDDDENFDGDNNDSMDDEEVNEDDDDEINAAQKARQQQKVANAGNKIVVAGKEEPCTFDLRNLLAMSSYPIDSTQLYSKKAKAATDMPTKHVIIPPITIVNEEYLLQKSVEGCNQLISALWQLPVERSDAGPMVILPSYDESKIPRKLPPPTPKAETKWEKFAKAKGIGQNKDKRSAKVWDESIGDWQYRHGYKKAGNDSKEWPIMEVKAGDDPMSDPWEKQRDAKRKRVDKNIEQHMRNEERAGNLSKGTSTRVLKSITAGRKAGREGGKLDLPIGVPVDLKSSGKKGNSDITGTTANTSAQRLQRGKASISAALLATQVSTASLGKFDKMREGEPERNKAISKSVVKKRKFESTTDKNVLATEAERSMKVLKSLSSGGVAKEKDRKKGRLATGETAYDYDYDDGLGASTFRKKKGRAGAGKMKKMTKKRTK